MTSSTETTLAQLADVPERLQRIEHALTRGKVKERFDQLGVWSLELREALDDHSVAIRSELSDFKTETNQRFDGLEGRFDTLEGRFDNLEGRFDNLEVSTSKRFDRLEELIRNWNGGRS